VQRMLRQSDLLLAKPVRQFLGKLSAYSPLSRSLH
jgi:hypothetical protein